MKTLLKLLRLIFSSKERKVEDSIYDRKYNQ